MAEVIVREKMVIPEALYKEIEEIVGAEYVSVDPIIRGAYRGRGYARELLWMTNMQALPAAVVLPHTAEEVSAIIKACNKYKIPFVPMSTAWSYNANARFRDDMIIIDLRRFMQCDVDVRNLHVITGTGIRYGEFNAELSIHNEDVYYLLTGGGGTSGVVANNLVWGCGPLNYRMGLSQRRRAAVEWVTPEGDIVKCGSLTTGKDEWFWGEGPGPAIQAIIRGHIGWFGRMGIVTRMGIKVFPFVEEKPKPYGITPDVFWELPERCEWQSWQLPSEEALEDCMYRMGEAEVGAAIFGVPWHFRLIARAKSHHQYWEMHDALSDKEVQETHLGRVLVCGFTNKEHFDYDSMVIREIMAEVDATERRAYGRRDRSWLQGGDPARMWFFTYGYFSVMAGSESIPCARQILQRVGDAQYKYFDFPKGPLYPLKGDHGLFYPEEFSHSCYNEFYCNMDPALCDMAGDLFDLNYIKSTATWHFGVVPYLIRELGFHDFFSASCNCMRERGPFWHNFQVWADRFIRMFDPKDVSNPPAPYDPEAMLGYLSHDTLGHIRAEIARSKRG